MPKNDGTGPMGMGPMTGRGAGYCANTAGISNRVGIGCGFGRGRGYRRNYNTVGVPQWSRRGYPAYEENIENAINDSVNEKTALKNQANYLEKQLEQIKLRLKDLDEE